MEPLISVIIPVFQVEKYLEKSIASVVAQTYHNLEIILVDDGSTDHCPAICDEWKERDSRIIVIHKPNGGLSQARNAGLKIATGEFIGFVDSDDWIEADMYETLLSALLETGADIAVCNYQIEPEKRRFIFKKRKTLKRKLYSSNEILSKIFRAESYIHNYVWNKLFRRNVLVNFPDVKIYEDFFWTPRVIGNSEVVVCINNILYHYLIRNDSLCHDACKIEKRVHDGLVMIEQRNEYIHIYYPSVEKLAILSYLNFCYSNYLMISMNFRHLNMCNDVKHELYQRFCQYKLNDYIEIKCLGRTMVRILFWIYPNLLVQIYILYKLYVCKILFL